jgi:adenylate kinase family enzyme
MSTANVDNRYRAILLLGATGSGKTPLGILCEREGLWKSRCLHFDFGEQLRRAEGDQQAELYLSGDDITIISSSLKTGRLLEKGEFYIAEKIFRRFIEEKRDDNDFIVVMNGLPRHVSQAEDVDRLVDIRMLVYLDGSPEVIRKRIAQNSGGDRTGRIDDSLAEVERKLRLFEQRTLPLVSYYSDKGVSVERIAVTVESSPQYMLRQIEDMPALEI